MQQFSLFPNPFRLLPRRQWPLIPLAVLVWLLWLLAIIVQIPYRWLYPERYHHIHDFDGSDEQKARLVRWRDAGRRVGFVGHVKRKFRKPSRRGWRGNN